MGVNEDSYKPIRAVGTKLVLGRKAHGWLALGKEEEEAAVLGQSGAACDQESVRAPLKANHVLT